MVPLDVISARPGKKPCSKKKCLQYVRREVGKNAQDLQKCPMGGGHMLSRIHAVSRPLHSFHIDRSTATNSIDIQRDEETYLDIYALNIEVQDLQRQ